MRRVRPTTLLLCLPLALAACDDKAAADASAEAAVDGKAEANAVVGGDAAVNAEVDADASAEVEADVALPEGKIAAATLDLEAIATLLRSAEIKDGAALELAINDGERGIHSVDVDADGDVDYVRVVEARADGEVKLTLEAIPSSKLDVELAVPLATVVLKHDAEAEVVLADLSYTDAVVVEADADVEADLDLKFELDADAEVVAAVEAPLVTWAFEVERPVYEGSFVLVADLDPADFQLEGVVELVDSGEVKTAAELEAEINARGLAKIDIDADGTFDHIQVVEVRADDDVEFQFRAVPSARVDARFAVNLGAVAFVSHRAEATLSLSAGFSTFFSAHASASTRITREISIDAGAGASVNFYAWIWHPRPTVYVSAYVRADGHRFIPPGHLKHGHWKATGGGPPGHFKGSGSVKGHAGGHHGGHVDVHTKSHGHSSKGKAKGGVSIGFGGHGSAGGKGGSKGGKPSLPKPSSSKGGSSKGGSSKGGSSKGGSSKGGSSKGGSSKGGKGKK